MATTAPMRVMKFGADPRLHDEDAGPVAAEGASKANPNLTKGIYEYNGTSSTLVEIDQLTSKKDRQRQQVLQRSIPLLFVQEATARMEAKQALIRELFFFIVFFAMFVFLVVAEGSIEQTFFVSWSVGQRLYDEDIPPVSQEAGPNFGRTFGMIQDPADFFQWAEGTFVKQHYTQANPDTEAAGMGPNYVGGPNIQFGAARFRTQRVNNDSCALDHRWLPSDPNVFPQECYAVLHNNLVNKSAMQNNNATFAFTEGCFEAFTVGDVSTYDCSGNFLDVPLSTSRAGALNALALLRPNAAAGYPGFVDRSETRFVSVSFFTYNAAVDHFALTSLWLELTATGALAPGWRVLNFRVYSDRMQSNLTFSIAFFVAVLLYIWHFAWTCVGAFGEGRLFDHLLKIWSLLDILNLGCFLVLYGFRFTWLKKSQDLQLQLSATSTYDIELEYIAVLYDFMTIFNGINTVLLFLRILKFAPLSSRVGVINRTLDKASGNLINLSIIFLIVLMSYTLTATTLFGAGMRDFRDVGTSLSSLLRMLIGDMDYDGMKAESWYLAAAFFWSFIILGLFMLLNMMIAVIGDAFEHEQQVAQGAPIADEIYDFFASWKRHFERFAKDPKKWLAKRWKWRGEQLARRGKYAAVYTAVRGFRFDLPCHHISADAFLLMPENEQDFLLPNPMVCRADMTSIFKMDGASEDLYEYLTAGFMDDLWLDIVDEYRFFNDELKYHQEQDRRVNIRFATERLLRGMLGDEADQDSLISRAACNPVELFGPTQASMESLVSMGRDLSSVEDSVAALSRIVSQLDAVAMCSGGSMAAAAAAAAGGAQAAADTSARVTGYRHKFRRAAAELPPVADVPMNQF
jgi:hypothetical protein